MLTVFCDDSGTDGTTPFCVIAGYIASAESWGNFSDEWDYELQLEPSIKYLKMREAESRRGEFWGWDAVSRDQKLLRLGHVIKRHVIGGVASFVSHTAYRKIVKGFLPGTIDHPYWFCFRGLVLHVVQIYRQQACKGKIDLVFDSQGEGYERLANLIHSSWREVLAAPFADILGGIAFHSDLEVVPLQAADLLAWHIRRHADSMVLDRTPEDRPVADLLWSIPTSVKPWWPQELDRYVDDYQRLHPDSPSQKPI